MVQRGEVGTDGAEQRRPSLCRSDRLAANTPIRYSGPNGSKSGTTQTFLAKSLP